MSRNQREGKYAGRVEGRHYRSRGVNCRPGRVDLAIEFHMRDYRSSAALVDAFFESIMEGQP